MPESSPQPFILTLKLDTSSFERLNQLRQQYFPRQRNFLPAHVTLFHALPGDQEASIRQTLQEVSCRTPILTLTFPKLRFLGQGVAVELDSPELIHLHQDLAEIWREWLSRQDQQSYRPHITIQNKVTPEAARDLYDQLKWEVFNGKGEGLLLWRYQGGPWEFVAEFEFQG
jgi:2'-5' RNA ligase